VILVDLDASLAFVEGVVSPNRRKFRQAGFWAFTGWCNPRLSMDKYPTTKKTPNALLKKISPGQNIRFHGHYTFCGSRHPINLDAMVANLTLEEGWTRLPTLWIRSDSRNVMESCLTEISAVWTYNPG
jgi:hypothetical protein